MDKFENKEHIVEHPIVSTITDEIPVIRSVCNYWRETIRQSRETRLIDFLNNIAERVAKIEDSNKEFDKEHAGSDDYFNTIEQLTEIAVRSNDNEKISYLKNFAVKYSTTKRPDILLKDIYMNLVAQLSGLHFTVLNMVFQKQRNLSDFDLRSLEGLPERDENIKASELSKVMEIDSELLITLLYSLKNLGLITLTSKDLSDPNVIIEPIGIKLMNFVSLN